MNKSIVIVAFDDNEKFLNGIRKALEKIYDARVVLVNGNATAKSVAEEIKGHKPDIVLADSSLQTGFSGLDVLKALGKKFFAKGNPRVISISTYAPELEKMARNSFQYKSGLVSKDRSARMMAEQAFLQVVEDVVRTA